MTEDDKASKDKEFLRRMAAKDSKALEEFYGLYGRLAFTLVLRIVKVREDAEDVLTEVFWQVWQQAGRYEASRGTPLSWLLTIARTRAIDSLRSSGRRLQQNSVELDSVSEGSTAPLAAAATSGDSHVTSGIRRAVGRCLDALSGEQRRVLELAYFEGMSHTEIAAALKQPLGTMKDRIRTGMTHLRKCLKPYEASA